MTKDEALKLALEALEIEEAQTHYPSQWLLKATTTIKQALANDALEKKAENARELGLNYELEQEPVAYMSHNKENFVLADDVGNSVPNWTDYYPTPLYTTPPPCPTCEALARTVMMDQTGRDA